MIKKISLDEDYVMAIVNGDRKLIKEIYENYFKAILHLVETNNGTHDDAKDVFQEGLMLIYQKAQEDSFTLTSKFFTYLYSVCKNIWANKRRKKSNSEITLTDEMKSMVVDLSIPAIEENERIVLFRKKFLLLGEDCQELLRLFFQKIKSSEIMQLMNYNSVNYVKLRKYKCKEKLVKLIEEDPAYSELKTNAV